MALDDVFEMIQENKYFDVYKPGIIFGRIKDIMICFRDLFDSYDNSWTSMDNFKPVFFGTPKF